MVMKSFILKFIFLILFITILPIILISCLLVLIEDGSPVFFSQKRLGKNKKIFKIYKIRTMLNNTPNIGTHEITSSNYLKIGILLRKIKFDELPQVINFIKGDLEIVGPRPGLPSQKELTSERDKKFIFDIKPGITGLSQVLGYDMSNPLMLAKIDELYLKKRTIILDIIIFLATFLKFFKKKLLNKFEKDIKIIINNA